MKLLYYELTKDRSNLVDIKILSSGVAVVILIQSLHLKHHGSNLLTLLILFIHFNANNPFQAMAGFALTQAYKRFIYLCGGFQGDIDG